MMFRVTYITPKNRVLLKDVDANSYLNAVEVLIKGMANIDLKKDIFVENRYGRRKKIGEKDVQRIKEKLSAR